MKERTKNVILYLLRRLSGQVDGKKKLMKLMFLVEHFDPERRVLVEKPRLGNQFLIYYYGVFSFEVAECYEELVGEGRVAGWPPTVTGQEGEAALDEGLKRVVDRVVEEFGGLTGYELEVETLKMLGIEPYEKDRFFGKEVREIIKKEGRMPGRLQVWKGSVQK